MKHLLTILAALLLAPLAALFPDTTNAAESDADTKTLRVFIFAGQSNMVGSDSKVKDIKRFPPFAGLDASQDKVLFSYNIGREEKLTSKGWVALQPVDNVVGPELSFARRVSQEAGAPSNAAKWLQSTVAQSRQDLALPALKWFVGQQPPTDEKGLNRIDITANLAALAAADPAFIHLKAFDLPRQEEQLVITTAGIVRLGELLAQSYLDQR